MVESQSLELTPRFPNTCQVPEKGKEFAPRLDNEMDQGKSLEVAAAGHAAAQPEFAPPEATAATAATAAIGERGACRLEKEALIDALINVLKNAKVSRRALINVLQNVKVSRYALESLSSEI